MCALYVRCVLSVLQKECRKVWGAHYTLGACYWSENTVIGIGVSASAYYKNTSHLYRCTNTDLNMYVSMFFISSMFSSSSCRLDMRDSSLSLALLSGAFCLSASYCRWVLSKFTDTVSATSTRAVISFIAISYKQQVMSLVPKSDVHTVTLLRIQVFWDVTMCCWLSGS